MPIQSALALVGVGKQASKGTPAATPAFGHGVSGGGVIKVDVSQDRAGVTSGKRAAAAVDRTAVVGGFDYTTRCFPKTLGMWLYAALGGKSVTGAGPYVHTLTPADVLPLLTVFGNLDGTLAAVQDAMVDELELSWDENNPPDLKVAGIGGAINFAPTFTLGTDETLGDYLLTAGGTFKLDVDSATPVTAPIKAGSIKIANGLTAVTLSGSLTPDQPFPGRQDYETSLTLVPANLNDWRTVVTGAANGTEPSDAPVYGSLEVTFTNGTDSLKLEASRVPFMIEFPEASPDGGPVEIEATGMPVLTAAGGAALTATLTNGQATY